MKNTDSGKGCTRLMLTVVLFLAATLSPQRMATAHNNAPNASKTIYLPLVSQPFALPKFTIINPLGGNTVSGTFLFAIQYAGLQGITSVAFKAGTTDLGSDANGADGFQVYVDSSKLPTGTLSFSATATNTAGNATQSVTVNVLRNPPSSATVNQGGTTVATASGSTVVVPPNAANGATIAVQDKTQSQVTQEKGIDWDRLGVTFLGAIDVQTTGEITKPLGVSSVGFGNRVQPGQAVVTYRILPDADGDGIGELVVVNGANLAPNGTIVSSPVPDLIISSIQIVPRSSFSTSLAPEQPDATLHGAPGMMLMATGAGFNPHSAQGNLVVFKSLSTGTTVTTTGIAEQDAAGQTLRAVIPILPAGTSLLSFQNLSTGSLTKPITLTIDAQSALPRPAHEIVDEFLAQAGAFAQALPATVTETMKARGKLTTQLTSLRTLFQQLKADPSSDAQQKLAQLALLVEGSGVMIQLQQALLVETQSPDAGCLTPHEKNLLNLMYAIFAAWSGVLCFALSAGIAGAICAALVATFYATMAYAVAETPDCPPPPPCPPNPAGSGGGTTGMGSAPPPGGNGCGNAGGGSAGSLAAYGPEHADASVAGRYIIKVFRQSGSGRALSPFTGMTDAGGYFFLPLIPQGEPFRALATDRLTGASVTDDGIGPPTGKSVNISFDFTGAAGNRFPISIGDTVSNGVPSTGAGNIEIPGGVDIYNFSATAGQQVFLDVSNVVSTLTFINWRLIAPNGTKLFDQILNCCGGNDPGVYTLNQTGIYTIEVGNDTDTGTGTYQFKLWNVPAPNQFNIAVGDTISNGVPAAGAGNIESPGVRDVYTFNATAGQNVFFDLFNTAPALALVNWKLVAPNGVVVFDQILQCCGGNDPGVKLLTQTGTYTITVGDDRDASVGTYGFTLWNVPAPNQFSIAVGDTISNGVPAAGAGNIESPGVRDVYTFNATAGQNVFFDLFNTAPALSLVNWKLVAPNGVVVFDQIFNCCGGNDPGVKLLTQTGTYTITVGDDSDSGVGTYGFKLWNVPAPNQFNIAIGDTISNGVPDAGAGNIEVAGAHDVYTFNNPTSQQLYFDLQGVAPSLALVDIKLVAPNGSVVFDRILNCCGGNDPGLQTLSQVGTYTLTIGDTTDAGTGTYGFQIRLP